MSDSTTDSTDKRPYLHTAAEGGDVDCPRPFGDGPIPPFFSGKCDILSYRFAAYMASHGAAVAEEQRRYSLALWT